MALYEYRSVPQMFLHIHFRSFYGEKNERIIRKLKTSKLWFRSLLKRATEKYEVVNHPVLVKLQWNLALWVGLKMSGRWSEQVAFSTSENRTYVNRMNVLLGKCWKKSSLLCNEAELMGVKTYINILIKCLLMHTCICLCALMWTRGHTKM